MKSTNYAKQWRTDGPVGSAWARRAGVLSIARWVLAPLLLSDSPLLTDAGRAKGRAAWYDFPGSPTAFCRVATTAGLGSTRSHSRLPANDRRSSFMSDERIFYDAVNEFELEIYLSVLQSAL